MAGDELGGQVKVHPNPYSKEGLGQQVLDMGVAIGKLQTDMEWVKKTLGEIRAMLDSEHEERDRMIKEYQEQVDDRLDDHEERIRELEKYRSWTRGAIAGLSVVTFILSLVELLHIIGG